MGSSVAMCTHTQRSLNLEAVEPHRRHKKEKVVVVMGATGTGKSRLAIDLAVRFAGEIVNSDKMQIYKGLPILTNKMTDEERRGVPHHLIDVVDPEADFTVADFRDSVARTAAAILERGLVPILAGGSNSYIEAVVEGEEFEFCFLWVDVCVAVLDAAVSDRVDQMMEQGMMEEVREMFVPEADYSRGIRRSIGVPELDRYLRSEEALGEEERQQSLREAIGEMKINTCKLVRKQLENIDRLRRIKGWNLHRLDATAVKQKNGTAAEEEWEESVVAPSVEIARRFLYGDSYRGVVSSVNVGSGATAYAAMPEIMWGGDGGRHLTQEQLAASIYRGANPAVS